ncbi:MAG: hypothetical protein HN712_17725 [Gemmatimonadetes bacterium]|nr:hypothetical protein [Gemmatimonadota bacterium]MBT6145909.1 hypothetical protein [Gemmatimonadota bacterium]MBT7862161.1 hypothetical protein [Gemmatimonadota bacterium]
MMRQILKESTLLTLLFVVAVFMGAGPGLHLINPDAADPQAVFVTFGLPTIYVWGLFWYIVQFGVIVVAYRRHWTHDDD